MTPKDKKALTEALADLRVVDSRRAILGGRENATTFDLMRRIERLLEPESASKLLNEARAHVELCKPYLGKAQTCADRAAAEAKAEGERLKAAKDRMHERQAADEQARREREQRAVAQEAVKEIL